MQGDVKLYVPNHGSMAHEAILVGRFLSTEYTVIYAAFFKIVELLIHLADRNQAISNSFGNTCGM